MFLRYLNVAPTGVEHSSISQMFQGMLQTSPKLSDRRAGKLSALEKPSVPAATGIHGLNNAEFDGSYLGAPQNRYCYITPKHSPVKRKTG